MAAMAVSKGGVSRAVTGESKSERDWMELYHLAEQYFHEHGDLLVPGDYVCYGKRLGRWIGTQRTDYKKRINPRFTQERIELLEAIGMVWDVKEFRWNLMYGELERYLRIYGSVRVPQSFETPEGVRLGIWLNKIRMEYKKGKLSEKRISQLEKLGMIWEPEKLRRESWEHYFALFQDYVSRQNTFPSSAYVTENGVRLGIWLSNQKEKKKDGTLLPERRRRLEALGIVWDVLEQAWLERYEEARAYYIKHGHLCPYQERSGQGPDSLSHWLTAQRKARRAGTLSAEKIRMLEEIGMLWEVRGCLWERSFRKAEEFYFKYGHLRITKDGGEDQPLGRWISTQRKNYKKGKLSEERIQKLNKIGMVWDAGIDSEELWDSWYQKAAAYYVRYGHLNPQKGKLRTWIRAQRAAGKGKRGQLTESQIRRLEAIGMSWDPVEERWQAMYQLAKEYYDVHQMLNIPSNYVTDTGVRLGQWIARQRKCYKNYLEGKAGGGVGTITRERIDLLNKLDMIWDGTGNTAKTSFPEKALFFYLRKYFPDMEKLSHRREPGVELDLYIPSVRTAIEYDGLKWHRDKLEQDEEKGRICECSGIRLIRLREPGLPRISRCVFAVELEDFGDRAFEAAIAELFHYLKISEFDVDIARDRRAILETYRNFTARAWDRAYQELYGYYREHGTLSVPADLLSSDGINLAWWLYTQRGAYQDNELTALQIKKLESLGISWAPFEERWEYMYDLAAAYVRQHGDLMIPHDYITDQQERLGGWLARQRELYRRKELEPRRIRRLEQLGIQWEPKKMRQRRYLEAARAYQKAEGSLEVPFNYITKDGLRLGEWLAAQRKRYRAGRLDGQMIQELEGLGIRWEPYSSRWEEMFLLAQAYYEKHGDLCVPYDYVTGKDDALGRWIVCQRRKSRGTAAGKRLTEEQKEKLDAIGMVWDPYTEKWMKKYRAAEKFYQAEGHLKVPADFITEDGTKLGMWLASQRQAMRGNPNYLMNPERKRLLDAIGMDWSLKRTSPNARRRA